MLLVALFLIALCLAGGGYSYGYRRYGYVSFSPLGVFVALVVLAYLLGYIH